MDGPSVAPPYDAATRARARSADETVRARARARVVAVAVAARGPRKSAPQRIATRRVNEGSSTGRDVVTRVSLVYPLAGWLKLHKEVDSRHVVRSVKIHIPREGHRPSSYTLRVW